MMLLNAALMGGMAAAAAPIIVHIAHRRKATVMDWGAMRFLEEMLAKSRRRLFIEQWLLLAVRSLVLLTLALALTRPALEPEHEVGVIQRRGRTASVVLIDDSASTGAGRLRPAMDLMKQTAAAYIDTLGDGDEVSILRLSQLGTPTTDPLFDREAAKGLIDAAEPTDVASDVPALIEAGLVQLERHLNPDAEVVLLSDGGGEGWGLNDRARWAEIRRGFRGRDTADAGGRRPRLIVLGAGADAVVDNVAVTGVSFDRALVSTRRAVNVRVSIRTTGERRHEGARLRLLVDGRTVDERALELTTEAPSELTFQHTFQEAGSHVVEASVEAMRDSFERDDRRAVSIEVAERLPVLLVEGTSGEGLRGSLSLVALALDPDEEGTGLFDIDRISAANMAGVRLEDYRTIVLGDVPALDSAAVAAIERFVVTGGGVLVALGPQTDAELVNRFWARGGDGFLPAPLGERATLQRPGVPVIKIPSHAAFRAFEGPAGEAFKGARVTSYWHLDTTNVRAGDLSTVAALDNGDPLIVERGRGHGHIAMVTTSLDLSWSELGVRPAYVPLVRGLIEYLGSAVLPPRNLRPGDVLTHVADLGARVPAAEAPGGRFVPLDRGNWEGRSAFTSSLLTEAGVYRVYEGARKVPTYYVVSVDAEESTFEALPEEERDTAVAGLDAVALSGIEELRRVLDPAGRRPVEIWRMLVVLSLALLFAETLITRNQARVEGRIRTVPTTRGARS